MITFKNGKQLDTVCIYKNKILFQGAERSTLDIRCSTNNTTFDELKGLYTDADALSEIVISEGEELQSMHVNFSIPMELKLTTVDDTELYCMKLAQKSAIELAQEQQAADINDTHMALIELADMISEVMNNG